MIVRALWVFAAVSLVLAGCSDGDDEATDPSPPDPNPPSTTTEPADPFAVPTEIDLAYVNRVLDELDALRGESLRVAIRDEGPSDEAIAVLYRAVDDEVLAQPQSSYLNLALDGFSTIQPDPGDPATEASELLTATEDCISAVGTSDSSAFLVESQGPAPVIIELRPAEREGNATGWILAPLVPPSTDPEGDDPCA